jgi:c-di-GMP-binding flagellar brake protein YcgR
MPDQTEIIAGGATQDLAEHHRYLTKSRLEIRRILNSIMEQGATLSTPVGGDDLITSIVAVDEDEDCLLFDSAQQHQHNENALEQEQLFWSTSLEKIKIQFGCPPIEFTEHEGRRVLKTEIPRELMRLQRREYYRMSTPINPPIKCTLNTRRGATAVTLELKVLDISCGGVSMVTPPEVFAPELGAVYSCIVDLPGKPLRAHVQARNAFMTTLDNGKVTERSGFAFVNLTENQLSTIQRYIMDLERQRKGRG